MLKHLRLLLCLIPGLALAQTAATIGGKPITFGSTSATWTSSGTVGVPSNLQVAMQGQNVAVATSSAGCTTMGKGGGQTFEPNWNAIAWRGVSGATQYNIYRAVNGGSYPSLGSPTYTVTASTSASNYSTYASQFPTQTPVYGTYLGGAINGQGPVPNIDHLYTDTSATNVIGNGGTSGADFTALANITSGSTTVVINSISSGSVATGQGIGDTAGHIPIGTTLVSGPGGTGTYTMSQAATANGTGVTVGAVLWGDQGYTYKVSAVNGGVESAMSTDAIIGFAENGAQIMQNGAFDSCVGTNQTVPTTPLGYTKAVGWWPVNPGGSGPGSTCTNFPAYMNVFSGYSAVNYNMNAVGYKYLNISFYSTQSGLGAPSSNAEICGDAGLTQLNGTQMAAYGPSTWSTSAWNTYKIPFSAIFASLSGVPQTAMYKITWGLSNNTPPTGTTVYVEYYWSVN